MIKTKKAYLKIFLNDLLSMNLHSVSVACNRLNGKSEELDIIIQKDDYSMLLKKKTRCSLEVIGQPVWKGIIRHIDLNGEDVMLKCVPEKRRMS